MVSYTIPALCIALISIPILIGISMFIAKLRGEKEIPTWVLVVMECGVLISLAVIFFAGTLLGWETPI